MVRKSTIPYGVMLKFVLLNKKEVVIIYKYTRLRDLREDNDLTQSQIAEFLRVGITTYRRWESGEREVPFHIVIQLAKYYKVSIDFIAGLTNKSEPVYKEIHINGNKNKIGKIEMK